MEAGPSILKPYGYSPSIPSAVVTHFFFSVANATHLRNNLGGILCDTNPMTPIILSLVISNTCSFYLRAYQKSPEQLQFCQCRHGKPYQRHLLCFLLLLSLWLPAVSSLRLTRQERSSTFTILVTIIWFRNGNIKKKKKKLPLGC